MMIYNDGVHRFDLLDDYEALLLWLDSSNLDDCAKIIFQCYPDIEELMEYLVFRCKQHGNDLFDSKNND